MIHTHTRETAVYPPIIKIPNPLSMHFEFGKLYKSTGHSI